MNHPPVLVDSIAEAAPSMAGQVVVCGSHGGRSSARYVLALPRMPLAVFFNDAGVGKERAGIVALDMLQQRGVVAAAYAHDSARIGEAADALAGGRISVCNAAAHAAGIRAGMPVGDAVRLLDAPDRDMLAALPPAGSPPAA
ncbi:MAG: hypothetical protein AB7P21_15890 [Lautropia sp.]